MERTALAAMLTLSCGVQPCTHANSTLCSWLVPFVTGLFLTHSACFRACSWVVPLATYLFLACSACYWLVPLVPCFGNIGDRIPKATYVRTDLFELGVYDAVGSFNMGASSSLKMLKKAKVALAKFTTAGCKKIDNLVM